MMNNSRRDLFKKVVKPSQENIVLGRIAEFPPGGETYFPDWQLILESLPEGIRVRSKTNPIEFFKVELNRQGEILVRKETSWPLKAVLSVIKNERIDLENENEELRRSANG